MRLIAFGTIIFPNSAQTNDEHSMPVNARSSLVALPNGAFDQDGSRLVLDYSKISYRVLVVNDIDNTVNTLLKEVGKGRGILQAMMRDGLTKWVTFAKLTSATRVANASKYSAEEPMAFTFEQDFPFWMNAADGIFFDSGYTFDSGQVFDGKTESRTFSSLPHNWTISNDGSARGIVGTITIQPQTGATLVNPKITNAANGMSLQWTGTLVYGDSLVIDFLTKTVEKNGTPDYANLSLSAPNQVDFMALELGDNPITVTGTIAGTVNLYWSWKRLYL